MDTDKGRQMPEETTEALYEQRQWLQITLSSIGDAVITTDAEGNITFLNPVAQALTGWTLEEAVGTPLDIIFRIVNEETRVTVEILPQELCERAWSSDSQITRCSSRKTAPKDLLTIAPPHSQCEGRSCRSSSGFSRHH
jgi:PAS domain-containing protein